jgi:hypothetical protein
MKRSGSDQHQRLVEKAIISPATVRFQGIIGLFSSVAKYPYVWVWRRDQTRLRGEPPQPMVATTKVRTSGVLKSKKFHTDDQNEQ